MQKNTRLKAVDQGYYNRGGAEIEGAPPPTSGRAYPGRLVDYGLSPGAYISDGTFTDPKLAACDPVDTVIQVRDSENPNGSSVKRCRYIYAATLDNLPDQDKADVYSRLTVNISKDVQGYIEASYASNHNIGRVAPVPIDQTAGHLDVAAAKYPNFLMPVTSKYFPTALMTQLGYTAPFGSTEFPGYTEIAMRAVPVGNRINDNRNAQGRLVGGVRGTFGTWDFDSAIT